MKLQFSLGDDHTNTTTRTRMAIIARVAMIIFMEFHPV